MLDLSQVTHLLDKQLVEEAVLLAETIAAVEKSKNRTAAEEVGDRGRRMSMPCMHLLKSSLFFSCLQYMCEVKLRAAFIYFSSGAFSQAEALFLESDCDPREVCVGV